MKHNKLVRDFKKSKNLKEISIFFLGLGVTSLLLNYVIINSALLVLRYEKFLNVLENLTLNIILCIFVIILSLYIYYNVDK